MQKLFVDQWDSLGGTISDADKASLFPTLKATGNSPARVIGHQGGHDANMKKAYLRAIDTSKESITIADPYITDEDVFSHLDSAAKRGVDVRVILPKHNDEVGPKLIAQAHYPQMIDAGVKVFEYTGAPMAHDKVAVFDHHIATIGSSNLDRIALDFNDESNVWVDDPEVAGQLDDALTHDEQTSIPVTSYRPTLKQNVENHFGDWIVSWV
jgi:cardiolipin synthase